MYFIEFFVAVLVIIALVFSGVTMAVPVLGIVAFLVGVAILLRIQATKGALIFGAVYAVPLVIVFLVR